MPDRDHLARVAVRRPMNDHGTLTVELCETNEIRHLCAYATPELERRLGSLPTDAVVRLAMSRIGIRADVWRATAIGDRRPGNAAAVGSGGRRRHSP